MISPVSQNLNNVSTQDLIFGKKKRALSPMEDTQKIIDGGVDSVVHTIEQDRKKKSYKRAVAVGAGVVLTTALVAVLNPRMSGKTFEKLKARIETLKVEGERIKDGFVKKNWNKLKIKSLQVATKLGEVGNDINNGKDILWKKLCVEKKDFSGVKFKPLKWVLEKIDSAFVFLMKKPHEWTTKFFDKITKHTVKNQYKSANKQIEKLNAIVNKYKGVLSKEEQNIINNKLQEIENLRLSFSEAEIEKRLLRQEEMMKNLEKDVKQRFAEYGQSVVNKNKTDESRIKTSVDKLEFFSEKILQPQKESLAKERADFMESLVKKDSAKLGKYDEIIEILNPHLTDVEKSALNKSLKKTRSKIYKAGHTECLEYFDKKRDLTLGSAPTDVVSALLGLGLAGYAVGKAKNENERINRAVAVGAPAVIAVGTSLTLTSLLFTGVKNMLVSGGIGFVVSRIGSIIANKITGEKDDIVEDGEPYLLAKSV